MDPVSVGASQARDADADVGSGQAADLLCQCHGYFTAYGPLLLDHLRIKPQESRLYFVRIHHRAPEKDAACAGDVRKALGNLSAGAALSRCEGQSLFLQEREHRLLNALHIHPIDKIAEPLFYMRNHRGHHLLGLRLASGLGRHLQQAIALLGVRRHGGVYHDIHLIGKHVVDRTLSDPENPD